MRNLDRMRRVKLVAIVVVSILVPKVEISLALLMMLIFFLGFVVGILVPTYFLRKTDGKTKSGPGASR
jgi:uncharacterized membrane protein YciS (DUF1049 family)